MPIIVASLSPKTLKPSSFLTLSHHFYHTLPPHNFTVNVNGFKCRDDDCRDFLPWLENKAGIGISSSLFIGKSNYGRSLFASKNVKAGDCLMKVPFSVQITPDDLLPELKPFITSQIGNVAKLAVIILVEQKKSQVSEWAPYISCLPRLEDMHSTLFWSEQELKMIQHSSVYHETVDQQAQVKNEYLALRPVLDCFPQFFKDVSFENFRHAYGLDFLNHGGTSESFVLNDEDNQLSEVIADRNYVVDEEVLIRYGKFSNAALLLDFGFTVPCNSFDQVCVQFDISSDDYLRAKKLELLRNHHLPKMKVARFSSSDGSFVIKKVKSSRGKGEGIPQSLRAFARVMCCNTSKELDALAVEAAQHDGRLARRPLANRSLELRAHKILVSRVNHMIDSYSLSKSLQSLEFANCKKQTLRQRMAQGLLTGEVQVLKSAAAWLENYCAQGNQIFNPGEPEAVD